MNRTNTNKAAKVSNSIKILNRFLFLLLVIEAAYVSFLFVNSYIYKAKQGDSSRIPVNLCLEEGRRYTIDEALNDPRVCDLEIGTEEDLVKIKTSSEKLGNVRTIYFRKTPNTSIPSEIADLKNLHSLNFHHTINTYLPPEVGELKNLAVLHITQADIDNLSSDIGNLSNLENLTITFNTKKIVIPNEIKKLKKLKVLALNDNPGVALPSSLENNSSLEEINLTNSGLNKIPDPIYNLNSLKVLNLSENNLNQKDIDELKVFLPQTIIVF